MLLFHWFKLALIALGVCLLAWLIEDVIPHRIEVYKRRKVLREYYRTRDFIERDLREHGLID